MVRGMDGSRRQCISLTGLVRPRCSMFGVVRYVKPARVGFSPCSLAEAALQNRCLDSRSHSRCMGATEQATPFAIICFRPRAVRGRGAGGPRDLVTKAWVVATRANFVFSTRDANAIIAAAGSCRHLDGLAPRSARAATMYGVSAA